MSIVESATRDAEAPKVDKKVDLKLEVVVIPVADADRSKGFYERLGWRLDADFAFDNDFRVIQFTPPGSAASIQFGTKIITAAPGSAQGLYLIVSDIDPYQAQPPARGPDSGRADSDLSRCCARIPLPVPRRGCGGHQ